MPIRITECPRDAIQGWHNPIATADKVNYLKTLNQIGFDVLDLGSFVSPKAIPQMADTQETIERLKKNKKRSQWLTIIANVRGAEQALNEPFVDILGYPLSVSETFQINNTNRNITTAKENLKIIADKTLSKNKTLVVYLSMAFGNPYKDKYSIDLIPSFMEELIGFGIKDFSLADTVGSATPTDIFDLANLTKKIFDHVNIGLHLHTTPDAAEEKVIAALEANMNWFDSSINGIGGCPFAQNDLVGNLSTQKLLQVLEKQNISYDLNNEAFLQSIEEANKLFV